MIPNNILDRLVLVSKLMCITPRTPLSSFGNCGIYAKENTEVLNADKALG